MSATVRDLLRAAEQTLAAMPPDLAAGIQSARIIGHCARLLRHLETPHDSRRTQDTLIQRLRADCETVEHTWPHHDGHAESLAGAGIDILARASRDFAEPQRWAVAVEIASLARRSAALGADQLPHAAIAQLHAVRERAAALEQHAAAHPPSRDAGLALDTTVPVVSARETASTAAHIADATTALRAATLRLVTQRTLTVADLLAAAAAAEAVASLGITLVCIATDTSTDTDAPWAATGEAWHAVRRHCAPFDDGTKFSQTHTSDVITWAVNLEQHLHAARPARTGPDLAEWATATRSAVNQLPELARHLGSAVHHWAHHAHLLGRERNLTSYEGRTLSALTATNRVVFPRVGDLSALQLAVSDADRLSIGLAATLAVTPHLGDQPQPELAAHFLHLQRYSTTAGVLPVRAERVRATVRATGLPRQWGYAPSARPPHRGVPR